MESDLDSSLRNDISRILVRPAANIFPMRSWNGGAFEVQFGEPTPVHSMPWAFDDVSRISVGVGAGIWLRICAATASGERCIVRSTRAEYYTQLGDRLTSVEARPAATLFRNQLFETPSGRDSLSLPIASAAHAADYLPADLGRMDDEASAVFVAPGIRALLCRGAASTECQIYEPGPHVLHGTWNNAISSATITPAVTIFERPVFDMDEPILTMAPGEILRALSGNIGSIADDSASSVILSPFVRLTVCVDARGPGVPGATCTTYHGGRGGSEIKRLPAPYDNSISYAEVAYE